MASSKNDSNISIVTSRLLDLILKMPFDERRALLKELEQKYATGKRDAIRKNYFMDVEFASGGRLFKGFIQNISSAGLFIETRESFEGGEKITLTFQLPDDQGNFKAEGEIVRIEPEGIGVKLNVSIDDFLESQEKGLDASF